jgi:ABC-type dipeptide/oligopeptide/nickel transport system permease component
MTRFLLRRLAHLLPVALLVATLVFSLLHLVPGDPIEMMLGDGAQAGDVAALRQRLGLDQPLAAQYGRFLAGLARGDLGVSIHSGEPVTRVIARHYPATLELALASLVVALAIALPLGIAAAVRRGGWVDHLSRWLALAGVSLPGFWLGPMLILLFAVHWGALPVSGRAGPASLLLPAVTLGAALAGLLTRMVRAALAEELVKPYVVAARGKGLAPGRVVARHALKNALVPVITVVGLQFGNLLTGAIIAETIFSWPGLGRLLIQSIRLRDYPLVQGGVLVMAVTYVLVNLLTDAAYAWVDPRIRLEAGD